MADLTTQQPLTGTRVLDLSPYLPGPYCSLILARFGAEVIKVERPGSGDPMRHMPPLVDGESVYYQPLNRGKKSLTLDLKSATGHSIFLDMARTADVVLEGFRPGVMERLSLGYETLQAANPRLIVCSLSGYGQNGPYRARAGHDVNYGALAGLLDLLVPPGVPPSVPGVQLADVSGSIWAAIGILLALIARERSGQGQYLDVAMLDTSLSLLPVALIEQTAGLDTWRREAMLAGSQPCYRVYETADGKHMALGALEPKFWRAFCAAVERPDLVPHQFDPDRVAEVGDIFRGMTQAEWIALLTDHDTCCEPVTTVAESLTHPQVTVRQGSDLPIVPLHGGGSITLGPAPRLGEHTGEILTALGYSTSDIERWANEGVT